MLHAEMHRIGRKHIGQGAGCGEKRRNRLPLIRRHSERTPSAAVQVKSDEGQTGQIHPDEDQRRIEPDHTVLRNQDRKETKRFAQAVMMEGGQDVPAVAKAETESGDGEVTLEKVFEETSEPPGIVDHRPEMLAVSVAHPDKSSSGMMKIPKERSRHKRKKHGEDQTSFAGFPCFAI